MRLNVAENKRYANLKKCVFCTPEIPVLGYYVSKKGLRQWLGLANYLHKYTKVFAGLIQPLLFLLTKYATWSWRPEHQAAFDSVKKSLVSAPILMLPDDSKPSHAVRDVSDFAIGCALMQFDNEGHERVSFFAEYNFVVHYKPAKNNILADALSRRPDYDPRVVLGRQVIDDEDEGNDHCAMNAASGINLTSVSPEMDLRDGIVAAYVGDAVYANILAYHRSPSNETLGALSRNTRNQINRHHLDGDLLYYNIDRSMRRESSCPTTTICKLASFTKLGFKSSLGEVVYGTNSAEDLLKGETESEDSAMGPSELPEEDAIKRRD
ncbi:Gag/polymerase/env Polyprotein [Phytophthora palmivora]|uniref:Gag/polymerase/env Polyprotein n=1 Tax=Phytophthora palmivora TaxID=4796 RepID=A0A2P4X3C4_9STRA|nr:Gag/polymerase/env Polyprotein [Phytophthora palmivora]